MTKTLGIRPSAFASLFAPMLRASGLFALMLLVPMILLIAPTRSDAQWALQSGVIDQQIHRGIELIYNMEFDQAERIFDSVISESPAHPSGYFYRATVMFWRVVTNPDNTTLDADYRAWLQKALDRSDALLKENDADLAGIFYKGAALGMRARIFSIRPNWKDALGLMLGDAKDGVHYLNAIEDIIPGNADVLFGRGLYNYYVEAVKEDYPALSAFISMFATGNKRVGLQMLEQASQRASYARTEAEYELLRVYYLYEHNHTRAYQIANDLVNRYPNNVQFLHYLGFCEISLGLTAQYDSTYRVILARSREKREGYTIKQAREAMHFLGQAQLYLPNGNLDSALNYLYNADLLSRKITPTEPEWYLAKEELMMGQAYDALGKRDKAIEFYKRVMEIKDISNSHSLAQTYLAKPYKR